ncbi:MAG: hypothetical protein NPIRA05_05420 [Nitrospirales bacterium]|nr:MAG: hypothetical protein NPIRA05_05420 [Nitrospirales bacterium]
MTKESVAGTSFCKNEWDFACERHKYIVPLRFSEHIEMPLPLRRFQCLDFATNFEHGLNELRQILLKGESGEGRLNSIAMLMTGLTQEISQVSDINPTIKKTVKQLSLELDELPEFFNIRKTEPHDLGSKQSLRVKTDPPVLVPNFFQGREAELGVCAKFLDFEKEERPLLSIVGRPGIGKTTLICRLLQSLERAQLSEVVGSGEVYGLVYINSDESHGLSWASFFSEVANILEQPERELLETLYKEPGLEVSQKMRKLLNVVDHRRIVVLIDAVEKLLDPVTHEFIDLEMKEALRTLLAARRHSIKVILTSHVPLPKLSATPSLYQIPLNLNEGLPPSSVKNVLREMDSDASLGLKDISADVFDKVCELTNGIPRNIVKLVDTLQSSPSIFLSEIVGHADGFNSQKIFHELIEQAFNLLDSLEKRVVQVLSVFSAPISPEAVNFVLELYSPDVDSEPILRRLVAMKLVHKKEGKGYFLEKNDRLHVLSSVPEVHPADHKNAGQAELTLFSLRRRCAEFYKSIRLPTQDWNSKKDIEPQLAEFDLRYEGQEYEQAASILKDIWEAMLEWGHYRPMAECYKRLRNKLVAAEDKDQVLQVLGWIYEKLGEVDEAISCYQEGLSVSRHILGRKRAPLYLSNLAICYEQLNNIPIATLHCVQALRLAHDLDDQAREALGLNVLGDCSMEIGMMNEALDCYERSLELVSRGQRRQKVLVLVNLARLHCERGDIYEAEQRLREAFSAVKHEPYPLGEAAALILRAEQHIKASEFDQGHSAFEKSIRLADEIKAVQLQMNARIGQALAFLFQGKLDKAFEYSDAARQYEGPKNKFLAHEVHGLTALCCGKVDVAIEAFEISLELAQKLLDRTYQNYRVLNARGLSWCGLMLCKDIDEYIPHAMEAFRTARNVIKSDWTLQNVLRKFDELTKIDHKRKLSRIRAEILIEA